MLQGAAMDAKTTSLLFTQAAKHTAAVVVLVLSILVQMAIATATNDVALGACWLALACVTNLLWCIFTCLPFARISIAWSKWMNLRNVSLDGDPGLN